MKITESAVKKHIFEELARFSKITQLELGHDAEKSSSQQTADWVDRLTFEWQQGQMPPKEFISLEDLPLLLGFTWGEVIVAAHGWQWLDLTFHEFDDWETMAVVSPDRSLMIMPFAFVHQCINDQLDVTIAASLNVIGSSTLPKFPAGSYTNLMDGLQRIIPRV